MMISERKQNAAIRWTSSLVSALLALVSASAYADNASWMEDHARLFGDHTLETLSFPASHDAGMYMHEINLIEIGIKELGARAGTSGLGTVLYTPFVTGVLEGSELLQELDRYRAAVRSMDRVCTPDLPVVGRYCFEFGLEDVLSDFFGLLEDVGDGLVGNLSITQNRPLYAQLSSGIRMFDLRPKKQRGDLYIHHSQGNIKKGGHKKSPDGGFELKFYVPCVHVGWPAPSDWCVVGTAAWYNFGTIYWDFSAEVMSISVTGPLVDEVLADVRRFMQEEHRELVVLDFTHYWAGYNGDKFGAADYDDLIELVENRLGPWLLTDGMLPDGTGLTPEERLADATLSELLGAGGRVLAVFETKNYTYSDPARGIWPNSVVSTYPDECLDGCYSETDLLDDMRNDQRSKFEDMTHNRFELSWTLTCPMEEMTTCSVGGLAYFVNLHLVDFVDGLTIPNANGNTINEIWADFVDNAGATEIAIMLNNTADPDQMMSCQASQLRDSAKLCKAVFACYEKLVKNKLKAPADVRLEECLDKAEAKFLRSFDKALANAEKKDEYCGVESDPVDDSFITPIDLIIEEEAMTGWDPQRKDENTYRASMLKEGGALCSAALMADSKDVKKPDVRKWQLAREKARDKFESKMRKAADKALKNGVSTDIIDSIHCADMVEAVADDFSALSNGP